MAYRSDIEAVKGNVLQACVDKMASDRSSLQFYPEESAAANEIGSTILREMRVGIARMDAMEEKIRSFETELQNTRSLEAHLNKIQKKTRGLETHQQTRLKEIQKKTRRIEMYRQAQLNTRQRAIATWVRDALGKKSESCKELVRHSNKVFVDTGDCEIDVIVCIERYKKTSTEWKEFRILYGLTPEEMNSTDAQKCPLSLEVLDQTATYLFRDNKSNLPEAMNKARKSLVASLLQGKYEEAENYSSTLELFS